MGKSQYKIAFGGLPVGNHEFEFEVKDKFFQNFEYSEIEKADLKVKMLLIKQNNTLKAEFNIEGTIGVDCDRCLKSFDLPVEANESLVIKFGNPEESNDEILVINEGETEFDISQYLYEYALLALPARKVPCEIDEKIFKCDKATLKKLESYFPGNEKTEQNPLWEQLNKLKNKN
ncbi:MAG: DUF177 domain-containing protein [Sphingobacteriaceae bacterium]|nr:DUF177 domain-containing protein [Sphingobacteriaceae bacterium]